MGVEALKMTHLTQASSPAHTPFKLVIWFHLLLSRKTYQGKKTADSGEAQEVLKGS